MRTIPSGARATLLATAILLSALVSTSRGDYCYGWTEFSIEWVADASSAIVVGEVTGCTEEGRFWLRVDEVLKEVTDLDLKAGQVIEGPCLGCARHFEQHHGEIDHLAFSATRLGVPVYSEPSTYPGRNHPLMPHVLPKLQRRNSWGKGDRAIVFLGPKIEQIVQIVNLDQPLQAGTLYLAVDLRGKVIADPEQLIQHIEQRVAEGRKSTGDGSPKVCSHGFYYSAFGCELEGDDYHFIFAPPDPCLEEICRNALDPSLIDYAARGGELGVKSPSIPRSSPAIEMRMAIWYWFYSGRTARDYAGDRQRDFDRTLRNMHSRHQEQNHQVRAGRLHCRNYPVGWKCAMSNGAGYFAYIDTNHVYLYDLQTKRPKADRPLYRADKVDSYTSELRFSPDGRYFAYSEADGSLFVYDLHTRGILFRAMPPLEYAGTAGSPQLRFSNDSKYLAQVVCKVGRSDMLNLRRSWAESYWVGMKLYIWDVEKRQCVFEPYDQWEPLRHYGEPRIVGFHEQDSRLLRVSMGERWERPYREDVIWNVETQERAAALPDAKWQSAP